MSENDNSVTCHLLVSGQLLYLVTSWLKFPYAEQAGIELGQKSNIYLPVQQNAKLMD